MISLACPGRGEKARVRRQARRRTPAVGAPWGIRGGIVRRAARPVPPAVRSPRGPRGGTGLVTAVRGQSGPRRPRGGTRCRSNWLCRWRARWIRSGMRAEVPPVGGSLRRPWRRPRAGERHAAAVLWPPPTAQPERAIREPRSSMAGVGWLLRRPPGLPRVLPSQEPSGAVGRRTGGPVGVAPAVSPHRFPCPWPGVPGRAAGAWRPCRRRPPRPRLAGRKAVVSAVVRREMPSASLAPPRPVAGLEPMSGRRVTERIAP